MRISRAEAALQTPLSARAAVVAPVLASARLSAKGQGRGHHGCSGTFRKVWQHGEGGHRLSKPVVESITPQGHGEGRGLLFTEKFQEHGKGPPSPFQPDFLPAGMGSPSKMGSGVFAGCSSSW